MTQWNCSDDQWHSFVNTVMNAWVPCTVVSFLTRLAGGLLAFKEWLSYIHGVSQLQVFGTFCAQPANYLLH
jgi:hypothetical protein